MVVKSMASHMVEPPPNGNARSTWLDESLESRVGQKCMVHGSIVDPLIAVGPKGSESTAVGSNDVLSDGEEATFFGSTSVRTYSSSSDGFASLRSGGSTWVMI